jgi:sugar lactone lactonase YvrE
MAPGLQFLMGELPGGAMNTRIAIRTLLLAGLAVLAPAGLSGCGSSPTSQAPAPAAGSYVFWPQAPDEPRIQFLGAFNSSEDVAPTTSSALEKVVFGRDSTRPAFVNKPYGVAVRNGSIYVCDIRAKSLIVLDIAKKQTRLVGTTGVNKLERPAAVVVADDGKIYVADGVTSAIHVYDASERFIAGYKFDKLKPAALALHGDRLYLADIGRQTVLVIDRNTGKQLGAIGEVGDGEGQFRLPVGVTTDKTGNIYVSDMMLCRIQKFSPDGKFLGAFGEQGDHAGGFARPKHLTVDSEGILYVVDAAFQNVQMFNGEFKLLMHFGSAGNFPGAMSLPVGVAVSDTGLDLFKDRIHPGFDARRLVVVANQFGDGKINVYALGTRKPSYALADIFASTQKIATGVGDPSAEALKFQNIGGVEPGQEAANAQGGEEPKPEAPAPTPPPK